MEYAISYVEQLSGSDCILSEMFPADAGSGGPSALRLAQGVCANPERAVQFFRIGVLDLLLDRAPYSPEKYSLI